MMENRYEKHCGRKLTSKLWNFCPYCGECLGCGANLAMLAYEKDERTVQETACCESMLASEQSKLEDEMAELESAAGVEYSDRLLAHITKQIESQKDEVGLVDY